MFAVLLFLLIWWRSRDRRTILQYDLWLHGIGHISADPTLQEITVDKFYAPFKLLQRFK
jgi:hypothetical protein